MKLKEGFMTHNYHDIQIMMATSSVEEKFRRLMIYSNDTAAFIVDCLKVETSEEEILNKMIEEYEIDVETAKKDIEKIIRKLDETGVIEW